MKNSCLFWLNNIVFVIALLRRSVEYHFNSSYTFPKSFPHHLKGENGIWSLSVFRKGFRKRYGNRSITLQYYRRYFRKAVPETFNYGETKMNIRTYLLFKLYLSSDSWQMNIFDVGGLSRTTGITVGI